MRRARTTGARADGPDQRHTIDPGSVRRFIFPVDAREKFVFILENKERTLIVSSQLNVASVINRKMARVAHLVSGSHFLEIFGSGVLGMADPAFFPDILEMRWGVYEDGRIEPWVYEVR